jgi:anti-sigma regulatory factor (Ser/Thr protein kinase)
MREAALSNGLVLAATPTAPGVARGFVEHELRARLLPETLVEDAKVVVSELVTNAVQYTGVAHPDCTHADVGQLASIEVRVRVRERSVLVEVCDCGRESPCPSPLRDEDEHGRGLYIVTSLAAATGHHSRQDGETVWAELAIDPEYDTARATGSAERTLASPPVTPVRRNGRSGLHRSDGGGAGDRAPLPNVLTTAVRAVAMLAAFTADPDFEAFKTAGLRHDEELSCLAGTPIIDRYDHATDAEPLFTEGLRALCLKAAVYEATQDERIADLPVPVPVDQMAYALTAQHRLLAGIADRTGLRIIHRTGQDHTTWRVGDFTHLTYRAAWGDPPTRYWPDHDRIRRIATGRETCPPGRT